MLPDIINRNILSHKFLPNHNSCSESRKVKSKPISKNALSITIDGPKYATVKFAITIDTKYVNTRSICLVVVFSLFIPGQISLKSNKFDDLK